jgi:predicted anti-sigma-YlaC factor YlaD
MNCEEVRQLYLADLTGEQPKPEGVERHLETCSACRQELQALAATWTALAGLSLIEPDPRIGRALRRRVRWEAAREVIASVESWQRAALAGVAGFVVSVLLSLIVPYDAMVRLCESIAPTSMPAAGSYLLAGLLYGLLPMVLGTAFGARNRAFFGLPGAVEAALVFMAVLVPYVALRCGEFPAALFVGFVSGIALGAVVGGVAGIRVPRRAAWA